MHTVAAIILAATFPFSPNTMTRARMGVAHKNERVSMTRADYTNRAARVEAARARREANAAKREAFQTVRDNLKKRKDAAAVKAAVKKGGK